MFVGIDVAKAHLDLAVRPSGEQWRVPNDEAGIGQVLARVQALQPTLVVLEATGGLEVPLAAALAAAGVPVAVVNPRQVRDFAKAVGQLAKTDALDAAVLARFAEVVHPTPRPLPETQAQELSALVARRRQGTHVYYALADRHVADLIRNALAHIRQPPLMHTYHAHAAEKGQSCVIEVTPEQVEFLNDEKPG